MPLRTVVRVAVQNQLPDLAVSYSCLQEYRPSTAAMSPRLPRGGWNPPDRYTNIDEAMQNGGPCCGTESIAGTGGYLFLLTGIQAIHGSDESQAASWGIRP